MIGSLMDARAAERADLVAFACATDGRMLTWRELARAAHETRRVTVERRLPPGARIGLATRDPLTFTAGYLGVLAAGRTAVPIDPRLTADELASTTERLLVDVLITDGATDDGPDLP